MSSSSDLDWYKLNITTPGQIEVTLSHGSTVDFDWFLYATTDAPLTYKSTSSNPETGTYNITTAGTYFVRVKSYNGLVLTP